MRCVLRALVVLCVSSICPLQPLLLDHSHHTQNNGHLSSPNLSADILMESLDEYQVVFPTRVNQQGDSIGKDGKRYRKRRNSSTEIYSDSFDNSDVLRYAFEAYGRKFYLNLSPHRDFISSDLIVPRISLVESALSTDDEGGLGGTHCFYSGTVEDDSGSVVSLSLCQGLSGLVRTQGVDYFIEPLRTNVIYRNTSSVLSRPHIVYKYGSIRQQSSANESHCGTMGHSHARRVEGEESHFITSQNISASNHSSRAHTRHKRSISRDRYVEVMVVSDKKMSEYHGNNLDHYILTLLAMVASVYKDPSIGNSINIVIVRLENLGSEKGIKNGPKITSNAAASLKEFCVWQDSVNVEGNRHHDTAILLTRQDICRAAGKCDTLGLAELGTICDRKRSCAIIEDNGLSAAYTIAHELGHIFNLPHDDDVKCSDFHDRGMTKFHIMAPTLDYNTSPWTWSDCSAHLLSEFIDAGVAECLLNKPRKKYRRKVAQWRHSPGELYNVDKQCELLFGMGSKVCPYMPTCKRLWCTSRYGLSKGCRTQHMPWAEGTRCGANRWCHRGKCIQNTTLRKIDGGWSKWQKYGNCSRPCGGGIRSAERFCNNPSSLNGGKYCLGKRKKYKSCNIKNCPPSKMDFREEQCSKFNGRFSINGLPPNVQWVPKYSGILLKDECKLFCRASTNSAYYQLKDKVIDGTKCGPDTTDICVNGKCKRAGCDNRLGSDMKRDKCGVCGGDNSSCRTVTGTFNKVKYGYNFVTKIPSGALNIDIRQYGYGNSKDDDNYLVLMNAEGQYMLNGNYIVSMFRRHIKAHGATIEYSGSDTEMERVNSTDVLQEDLNLMVLSVGKLYPPDIRFSYSISVGGANDFQWNRKGPWGTCSHICSGRRRRKVICEHIDNGLIVSDEKCKNKNKPKQASSKCNKHCKVSWKVVYRGECDMRCGPGKMRLLVQCMKSSGIKEEVVDGGHCRGMGPRPRDVADCQGTCRAAHWMYTDWTKCSASCNGGVQKRRAQCVNDHSKVISDSNCSREDRILSQPCNQQPCAQWEAGDWTGCSVTCGSGQRHRDVMCKQGDKVVRGDYCSRKGRPSSKTSCKLEPCPGWFSGAWGGCSVTCGPGTRLRAVRCRSEDGQFLHDSTCDAARKPRDKESCFEVPCSTAASLLTPATPISSLSMGVDWRFGSWTQCSATCGEGTRMRYVGCADNNGNNRPVSDCSHLRKPDSKELCLARPCGDWRTGEWGECLIGCSQTRYVACILLDHQMGADKDCDKVVKPVSEQKCNRGDCLTPKDFDIARITSNRVDGTSHWRVGPWSDCSVTCGMGWQRRQVICQDEKGRSKDCGEDERPEDVRHCNQGACPRWNYGRWGQCSKTCGDGVRRRMVLCQLLDGQTLSDANCDILVRPSSEEQCKSGACRSAPVSTMRQWWMDQHSRCSVSCGVGIRERAVKCLDDEGNQRPDEECPGRKPKATKKCKRKKCPKWIPGPWSRCSVTCGVGTKHREIQCRQDRHKRENPSRCGKAKRPPVMEQCDEGACSDYEWRKSPWSECSRTCGFGMKSRLVTCVNKHRDKVSHQFCDQLTVPKSVRRCSEIPCPFIWNTGDWTTCSTTCGEGKQTRRVVCQAVSKEGWILPGEVSYACKKQERPPGVQYCNYGDCGARYRWMTGPWGQCTKTCGKGRMRRKVICVDLLGNKQRQRKCVASIRPKRSKSCYLGPCYAKSCAQLKEVTRIRQDGEYKLLVHGRFIEVYCKHMRKADPRAYITLPIDKEDNYAEIYDKRLINPASCPYNGTRRDICMACHKRRHKESGHTVFHKIRVDLQSLTVNIGDFAFSKTRTGRRIPFATAGDCYSGERCPQGRFSVDLTGTGLVVARNVTWALQGHRATKQIQRLRNGEILRGICGGNCGRCSPASTNGLQLELRL